MRQQTLHLRSAHTLIAVPIEAELPRCPGQIAVECAAIVMVHPITWVAN